MKITVSVKRLDNSEVEITGEIPADLFAGFWPKAIANLNQEAKVDGFRPGHAPEAVLVQKIGEAAILMEMADLALREAYPALVIENKIDALGRPNIQITKIAKDNPLGFKITTAVHPEIKFGDYQTAIKKVLAEPIETPVVTEEEISGVLAEIAKNKAKIPPEITDLKATIKTNLLAEKTHETANKRRIKVIEALVGQTTVTPPQILIDHELDTMASELKARIEAAGLKFADYLAHLKKTETEIRDGWKDEAKKQVTIGLAIAEIAKLEKLAPSDTDLENETKKLIEHYKDVPAERARDYVANLLTNQKVLGFLENIK